MRLGPVSHTKKGAASTVAMQPNTLTLHIWHILNEIRNSIISINHIYTSQTMQRNIKRIGPWLV
jgi:hypothetical protein